MRSISKRTPSEVMIAYWLFQKTKNPDSLQKFVEVIMERRVLLWCIDVWLELMGLRLDQWRFLAVSVLVQVAGPSPVVPSQQGQCEPERKGPEIQLTKM